MKPLLETLLSRRMPRLTARSILLGLCWLVCGALAVQRFEHAVNTFNEKERPAPEFMKYLLRDTTTHPARFNSPDPDTDPPMILPQGPVRPMGNHGHAQIDFGGQYLMGRLMIRGYGRDLYNRNRHWQVLNETFKAEHEQFNAREPRFWADYWQHYETRVPDSDVKNLMSWTMGGDLDSPRRIEIAERTGMLVAGGTDPLAACAHAVLHDHENRGLLEEMNKRVLGGALYPPVHALMYAPLAAIDDPRIAYVVFQFLSVLAMIFSGYCVRIMTQGRIWTPAAAIFLMAIPGCRPGIDLGQNQSITLAILTLGWALACRNRPIAGGIVWGFLAFKPVWAIAFGLIPVIMFRFRFASAMVVSGLTLCALTLPCVGINTWKEWLENGKRANETYNTNENWIKLSRDLSGIVRRFENNRYANEKGEWKNLESERNKPDIDLRAWRRLFDSNYVGQPTISTGNLISWILLLSVFAITSLTYWRWGDPREPLGLSTGFLMLGCYLCCYRFMYYDSLLAGLGLVTLLAFPAWYFRWSAWPSLRRVAGTFTTWRESLHQPPKSGSGLRGFWFVKVSYVSVYVWVIIIAILCDNYFLLEQWVTWNDPSETYCYLGLWLYSGILLACRVHRPEEPNPAEIPANLLTTSSHSG